MELSALIQVIFDNWLTEESLSGSHPGAPVQCVSLNLHIPDILPGVKLTMACFWISVLPASPLCSLVSWTHR